MMINVKKITHIIGIDEAGRGPLAGPVAVGVACVPKGFNWRQLPGVTDSKKLTEKKREAIFECARGLKKEGKLEYAVSMVSAKVIDDIGIVPAVRLALQRALQRLGVSPQAVQVKLDGSLYAPKEYIHQKTIIKGDSKERVIGLASIMAKVTRDRYMVRVATQYPQYGFEIHKGYGTKRHQAALQQYGRCVLHRKCFTTKYAYGTVPAEFVSIS